VTLPPDAVVPDGYADLMAGSRCGGSWSSTRDAIYDVDTGLLHPLEDD
jgi:hypothetical protein